MCAMLTIYGNGVGCFINKTQRRIMKLFLCQKANDSFCRKNDKGRITEMDMIGSDENTACFRNIFFPLVFRSVDKIGQDDSQASEKLVDTCFLFYIFLNKFFR